MRFFASRALALLAAVASGTIAQPAAAHELTVLEPGSGTLDAGDARVSRLIHATLPQAGQAFTLTVRPRSAGTRLQLLVPAGATDTSRGPSMRSASGGSVDDVRLLRPPRRVVDDVTGVAYLLLATAPIPASGGQQTVVVRAGAASPLVAVRVGPAAPFRTTDPRRTPRALAGLRRWAEAAPGTGAAAVSRKSRLQLQAAPWFGGAIALLAVAVAGWWGWRGRTDARLRGLVATRDTR